MARGMRLRGVRASVMLAATSSDSWTIPLPAIDTDRDPLEALRPKVPRRTFAIGVRSTAGHAVSLRRPRPEVHRWSS